MRRAATCRQRRDVRHNGEKKDFSWDDNRQLVAVRKGERLVRYGYDGLGRRVFKQTAEETRWFYWQGDALAGETVTITREPLAAQSIFDTGSRLQRQKAQAALFGSMREYVYYPGSFQPLALLTQEAGRKESWHYHCDPNGAPVRMTSLQGEIVWSEKTGVWGEKGEVYADRISNPLRFQGQYFDAETGLHYNRHRYYDPEIAGFISQDPIGLAGGLNVYQYAPNPLGWVDPWGLTSVDATGYSVYGLFESGAKEPYYVGITNDMDRRRGEHLDTERLSPDSRMEPLDRNVTYGQARGYEQYYIEKYKTRTGKIGEAISSTNRGNKYNSFDHGRKDARAKSFKHAYNSKKNGRKC